MCLDIAHDDVDAFAAALAASFKHGVRFAHAGHHPKEYLELAAMLASFLLLDERQQGIRVRTMSNHACLLGLAWVALIECQVEQQDIHAAFAQQPQRTSFRKLGNQGLDVLDGRATQRCDAASLISSCRRAYLWIEAAARGCDQVDRNWRVVVNPCRRIRRPKRRDAVLH